MPQAGATALTPALFVMQRGTRLPAARVLARRPHALAAPLLAAALVMAQGGQSPGTTSASVQVSPGSHDRGVFPGGPQVQRLGSRSPTGHFTRLARRFSPFVMLEFPVRRAVSERGGGLLRCTGSRECSLGCLTINSVRACCHITYARHGACAHTPSCQPRPARSAECCCQLGALGNSPGRVPRVRQSESHRHFPSRAHVQAGPAPWFSLRS